MSDKLKALIKEEIATILSEEEPGRYHDQLSSAEVAKDELQTAMLDGAREYLKTVIGKGSDMERRVDPASFQNRLHDAYSQLEDLLVDAMVDYNVPDVGVDEAPQPAQGTEVLEEERPEEFGVKNWGSDGFHDLASIERWVKDTKERLMDMINDFGESNLPSQHRAQLVSLSSKLGRAVSKAYSLGARADGGAERSMRKSTR